jgi:GAF domain-containing protein
LVEQGEIEPQGADTEDSTWLDVPLKAESRTIGVLAVQSYPAEHQYTDRDRDLLAFVGQHVGAALSRARAIEETRQRNAELALINSVQDALAGELEPQAIYDAVGDRVQEIFDAQVVGIMTLDETTGVMHFPYIIERGKRLQAEPEPLLAQRQARRGDGDVLRHPLLHDRGRGRDREPDGRRRPDGDLRRVELIRLFNEEQLARDRVQIQIGVGIASGKVVAGYTGTQQRATYTCVGDTVNIAARLESHTKVVNRPILIDEYTRAGLDDTIAVEPQGELLMKGKTEPIDVYAVLVDSLVAERL